MSASIVSSDANSVTIQVTIPFGSSMLATEDEIQGCLNLVGQLATGKALEQFDTDAKVESLRSIKAPMAQSQ